MTAAPPAPSDIASILDEIARIAGDLGDRAVAQAVETVRVRKAASRLQVRVVGPVGSGRATLVNLLLGTNVLPVSPLLKAPLGIDLRFGDTTSVTRVDPDGDRIAVPADQLRTLLLSGEEGAAGRVEITAPNEVLALCDLHIETLERSRSAESWRDLLAASDYIILVLNASALLSDLERRFVRDRLLPQLGLERVALLVNRMDLVPEEERESILALVHTFLGPFESRPAIIDLSLREMTRNGQAREVLTTLLDDLLSRREPMREEGLRQTAAALTTELSATAARLEALYALEASDVERARQQIAGQEPWLQRRMERTQQRVRAWVETLLRETLLRRIEGFGDTVRNRLPREIRSIEDTAAVRRHLPGYIETIWAEFMRRQMAAMHGELAAEEARVAEMIDADFRELLASVGEPVLQAQWDLGPEFNAFHVFITPRRTRRRAENIARGLALNGFIMLMVAPPLGVLSLLASQVVQRAKHDDLLEGEWEALTTSALTATRQVEGEVKRRINQQFSALSAQLEEEVAAVYRRGIEEILGLLGEQAAHGEDLAARRQEIRAIAHRQLPQLRERLGVGQ